MVLQYDRQERFQLWVLVKVQVTFSPASRLKLAGSLPSEYPALVRLQPASTVSFAATATVLEAAVLATETGFVRVILDIHDLAAMLQALNIDLIALVNDSTGASNQTSDPIQLTDQEQRVLELLAVSYSYPQIAREMVISLNTVRTHVRKLYRKLDASQRDQAIAKAMILGLLPGAEQPASP